MALVDLKQCYPHELRVILRHSAPLYGLFVQNDGFVDVETLLSLPLFQKLKFKELQGLVAEYPEDFELVQQTVPPDGWRIRAREGHSIEHVQDNVLNELSAAELERETLVYRSTPTKMKRIRAAGAVKRLDRPFIILEPAGRTYATNSIFLPLDSGRAVQAGIKFFRNARGNVVSPGDSDGALPLTLFSQPVATYGSQTKRPRRKRQDADVRPNLGSDTIPSSANTKDAQKWLRLFYMQPDTQRQFLNRATNGPCSPPLDPLARLSAWQHDITRIPSSRVKWLASRECGTFEPVMPWDISDSASECSPATLTSPSDRLWMATGRLSAGLHDRELDCSHWVSHRSVSSSVGIQDSGHLAVDAACAQDCGRFEYVPASTGSTSRDDLVSDWGLSVSSDEVEIVTSATSSEVPAKRLSPPAPVLLPSSDVHLLNHSSIFQPELSLQASSPVDLRTKGLSPHAQVFIPSARSPEVPSFDKTSHTQARVLLRHASTVMPMYKALSPHAPEFVPSECRPDEPIVEHASDRAEPQLLHEPHGPVNPKQKWLILPVSIPGCGKTGVCAALAHLFSCKHVHWSEFDGAKRRTQYLKAVKGSFEERRIVIADRNNHLLRHRASLKEACKDVNAGSQQVKVVALRWPLRYPSMAGMKNACARRIFTWSHGQQWFTPRAGQSLHTVLWQFLREAEPLRKDEVDAIVEMERLDKLERALKRVVEALVPILGFDMPTEERMAEAVEVARQYSPRGRT